MGVYSAACAYQKLLEYEYQFIIVRNRHSRPIQICLRFSGAGFNHLCGLHKLTDIEEIRREQRESILNKILQGRYTDEMFEKSLNYYSILDRIESIEMLESMLDDENTVFKFNKSANKYSAIDADFIIKNETAGIRRYYFISESNTKGQFFGRSCFSRTIKERDYTQGHTTYTVLQKTKVKLSTQQKKDLYIAPSYRQEAVSSGDFIQKVDFNQVSTLNPGGIMALNPTISPTMPNIKTFLSKLRSFLLKLTNKEKKSFDSEKVFSKATEKDGTSETRSLKQNVSSLRTNEAQTERCTKSRASLCETIASAQAKADSRNEINAVCRQSVIQHHDEHDDK